MWPQLPYNIPYEDALLETNTSALIKPNRACLASPRQQWPLPQRNTRCSPWLVFRDHASWKRIFGCQNPIPHNWMLIWEQRSTMEKQIPISHLTLSLVHGAGEWVERLTLYSLSLSGFMCVPGFTGCSCTTTLIMQQGNVVLYLTAPTAVWEEKPLLTSSFLKYLELRTPLGAGQMSLNPYGMNKSKYGIPYPDWNMEIALLHSTKQYRSVRRLYFHRADTPPGRGQVLQVIICDCPPPIFVVRALACCLPVGELFEETCAFACFSKPLVL